MKLLQVYISNGERAVLLPEAACGFFVTPVHYGESVEITYFDKDLHRVRVDGGLDPSDTYWLTMVTATDYVDACCKAREMRSRWLMGL